MSDLTDKQWEQYFAKSHRDIMWRALSNVRNAQASLQIVNEPDLYKATDTLANIIELRLKELYKPEEKPQ